MIREFDNGSEITILNNAETYGLGWLEFHHPKGTFALTPASRILLEAIAAHQDKLRGVGLDWGSGTGCLAILAARIPAVDKVIGLEISDANVKTAVLNAGKNNVGDKTMFMLSDSYTPCGTEDRLMLERLRGKVDFIVSNRPSSDWDDGFSFRRIVMSGAKDYLKKDGVVLLNISLQYGPERLASLYQSGSGFTYMGLATGTDWVAFDLGRAELLDCLKIYAKTEAAGGIAYTFKENIGKDAPFINAREALGNYSRYGVSPLSKWQAHLFKYTG